MNHITMPRKILMLLFLCIGVYVSGILSDNQRYVTKEEAMAAVKDKFEGQDVDFYILELKATMSTWEFFVDARPMQGWEHECYTLSVPKYVNANAIYVSLPVNMYRESLPPHGNYIPFDVKNRYGNNATVKPIVRKNSQANSNNPVAERTYAIILSGGVCLTSNDERYWNDCSFIYQTLVNKYGIPKNNIYPIMSDGDNPGLDMTTVDNQHVSQPLDLDGDNINDIELAATKANVQNTLAYLAAIVR